MLDLRNIIEVPGSSLDFQCEISGEELLSPSIEAFDGPIVAEGTVKNSAGTLSLKGNVRGKMVCVCDRCGKAFDSILESELDVDLIADAEDEGEADAYPIEGNKLDVEALVLSDLLLNMETKFLCDPDCKGICPKCGKDLNEGPCSCKADIDPRMAVLEQLLDK